MNYSLARSWCVIAVAAAIASTPITARADMMSACTSDISSLCSGVANGRGRISACLFSQASKLDAACKSEVEAVAKKNRSNFLVPAHVRNMLGAGSPPAVPAACSADEGKFCSAADKSDRSMLACLYAHSARVSSGCASGIETALK